MQQQQIEAIRARTKDIENLYSWGYKDAIYEHVDGYEQQYEVDANSVASAANTVIDELLSALDAAQARIAALEQAAQPFASLLPTYDFMHYDEDFVTVRRLELEPILEGRFVEHNVTVGDVRRLAACVGDGEGRGQ